MGMKNKIKVYLVHSVKGGSGKSAFSLFKAMTLAVQNEQKELSEKKENANVLYLDADFKGTATKTVLYGKDKKSFESLEHPVLETLSIENISSVDVAGLAFSENYQYKNLNDYFRENVSVFRDIVAHGGVYTEKNMGGESDKILLARLDFIFSSPSAQEKNLFQYEKDGSVLPLLNIGWYRMRMQQLLMQIVKADEYRDIVIDMPPGEDEYSRELVKALETLYADGLIELYWFSMTTNDKGHLDSEREDFIQKIHTVAEHEGYTRYVMVYNEMRDDEFSNLEGRIALLRDDLKNESNKNIDHCYWLRNSYKKGYYDFCRETVSGEMPHDKFFYKVDKEEKLI